MEHVIVLITGAPKEVPRFGESPKFRSLSQNHFLAMQPEVPCILVV